MWSSENNQSAVRRQHRSPQGTYFFSPNGARANPPFNMDFSDTRNELAGDAYKSRFFAGVPNIPKKDKEGMAVYLMFVQHIFASLNDGGRAAIVVPTTFLSKNSKIERKLRETLIDKKMLKGVITMPANLFATTTTSVSVLFISNDHSDKKVVLIDASLLGEKYKDGKNQRIRLRDEEIERIVETFKQEKIVDDFSTVINYEKIITGDYSFKIRQYFELTVEKRDYTPEEFKNVLYQYRSKPRELFGLDSVCVQAVKVLYDYWFGQYKFPDEQGKPYALNSGKMIFNEKLNDIIPEGWKVKRLDEVYEILLGGTPDTENKDYWDGEIPWLSSGEVAQFPITEAEKYITEAGMRGSATSFAKKGSILLSITRYIRASILAIDACFNQSVVAVIPNNSLPTLYLYPFIETKIPVYMALRTGAQQPHINKGTVEETLIVVPPESIMRAYIAEVEKVYVDILQTTKTMAKTIELSDFQMPEIMATKEDAKFKEEE